MDLLKAIGSMFSDDDKSPTYIVQDSAAVAISPQLGVDKAKMLKELESILGKGGSNCVAREDISHLSLPYSVVSEAEFRDMELLFELFASNNRGINGTAVTILSKDGLKALGKIGNVLEGTVETKNGWKFYLRDATVAETAVSYQVANIVALLPKYKKARGLDEAFGVPRECPNCLADSGFHPWLFGYVAEKNSIVCLSCEHDIKVVGTEWATRAQEEMKAAEQLLGLKIFPKSKAV